MQGSTTGAEGTYATLSETPIYAVRGAVSARSTTAVFPADRLPLPARAGERCLGDHGRERRPRSGAAARSSPSRRGPAPERGARDGRPARSRLPEGPGRRHPHPLEHSPLRSAGGGRRLERRSRRSSRWRQSRDRSLSGRRPLEGHPRGTPPLPPGDDRERRRRCRSTGSESCPKRNLALCCSPRVTSRHFACSTGPRASLHRRTTSPSSRPRRQDSSGRGEGTLGPERAQRALRGSADTRTFFERNDGLIEVLARPRRDRRRGWWPARPAPRTSEPS